jgi:hypothetical protein
MQTIITIAVYTLVSYLSSQVPKSAKSRVRVRFFVWSWKMATTRMRRILVVAITLLIHAIFREADTRHASSGVYHFTLVTGSFSCRVRLEPSSS